MRRNTVILIVSMLLVVPLRAGEHGLTLSLTGSYTTGARITSDVFRTDEFTADRLISANYGVGFDVRWNLPGERYTIGAAFERVSGVDRRSVLYTQYNFLAVPYEESYEVQGVELSGSFIVPISSDELRFSLGGGAGLYEGSRTYTIAGVRAETTTATQQYAGIHVMTGVDYRFHSVLGLRFEVKFRDPHFTVTSQFRQQSATYQGRRIPLPQASDNSTVNLFGVNYRGGIVVTL
ncbi:MAG: hypothetical protein HUU02_11415 [Bacteroidetes bacterium]|nr:hypothetical protein [Bacteroidota bacterium]